jgi:hypothetical protein
LVVRNVNFEGRLRCLGDVVGHVSCTSRAGGRVVGGEAKSLAMTLGGPNVLELSTVADRSR